MTKAQKQAEYRRTHPDRVRTSRQKARLKRRSTPEGLAADRLAAKIRVAKYRRTHPARVLAAVKAARLQRRSTPEGLAADRTYEKTRSKRRRVENPRYVRHVGRESQRKRLYGLLPGQFAAMLEAQAGLCGNCCRPMRAGHDTNIDHDHITGRVRGLLCRPCNSGSGHLQDDPLIVAGLLAYLECA